MREIDRRALEEFDIPGIILMEHAGVAVVDVVRSLVRPEEGAVVIVCGSGNNGGDGLVAARHLANKGYPVAVYLAKAPEQFKGDALSNLKMLRHFPVLIKEFSEFPVDTVSIVIDALLGTGTKGEITGTCREAIDCLNRCGKPIIAVDIPSGIDADTGEILGAAVKASLTVTMALPKKGMLAPAAKDHCGKVIVADIGIPASLLDA